MKKNIRFSGSYPSRRKFLRNAGISAAAVAGLNSFASSKNDSLMNSMGIKCFTPEDIILFQGDSITDAGRDKTKELPNHTGSLGSGYAFIIASRILKELAEKDLRIFNRGISGNKVYQLAERWKKDCIDLKPNVLSILIGVNDFWHMRNGNYDGTPDIYENDYRKLLNQTRSELPGIKLVICEPFVLAGTSAVDESWLEPFRAYQEIAAGLAREFEATWVPFQEAFTKATNNAPAAYWAGDGVHPTIAGGQLMAETWLQAACK